MGLFDRFKKKEEVTNEQVEPFSLQYSDGRLRALRLMA